MIHPTQDHVSDGETRRAVVAGIMPVGDSAVVDFAERDRPGPVHRAAVLPGPASAGLAVGDECVIRYRLGLNLANPAHWELVERIGRSAAAAPIATPASAPPTEREAARAKREAARNRQLAMLPARPIAARVDPPPDQAGAELATFSCDQVSKTAILHLNGI